jgi:hypothetical protein
MSDVVPEPLADLQRRAKEVVAISVTRRMFRRMEDNVEGNFLQRETWKSLMEQES